MNIYEVKDHAPSLLPDGMEFELVWADEFDGTELDTTKWDYRLCMMGKRHPSWTDKGVSFENSCAVFRIFEEDGEIVTSQLQTGYNFMDQPVETSKFWGQDLQWPIGKLHDSKYTKKYGYFECRCRLQQLPGWWSAFWLQSPHHRRVEGRQAGWRRSGRAGILYPRHHKQAHHRNRRLRP